MVPPSGADRPIHDLNAILKDHGAASAPGFFALPNGTTVWEIVTSTDAGDLERAFVANGWELRDRPDQHLKRRVRRGGQRHRR